MKLFYKFFFAFCITSFVAVGLMLSLITVNLSTSFNDFVNEAEHKQVSNLKSRIVSYYRDNGSWQRLKGNEPLWKEMLGAKVNSNAADSTPTSNRQNATETNDNLLALSSLLQTQKRLSLYDVDKHKKD
ncbi:hypothetical protein [Psychromonas arctica]|uniref:hypothetical protein n=1 Tax=Psychromonas arctica TaxID=168275 RepID=UPI000423010F|nr:hypothetical protein [Psychromonas arctica]